MPRTAEQNEEIQDKRREEILAAALVVFSKKGLGAARITDIAREAGMSQGLLYRYYSSKEEAYAAVIERALDRMNRAARDLEDAPERPHEKIKKAVEELLDSLEKSENLARTIMLIAEASSKAAPKELRNIIKNESPKPYKAMEEIFRRGQEEGTIYRDDPVDQALLFWGTIKGLAMHRAGRGKKYRSPDPETALRLFVRKPYRKD